MNVKPEYYNQFQCIASQCSMTCCQEWKITVDPETFRKWNKTLPPETMYTKKKNLNGFTKWKDQTCLIQLDSQKKCPFLDENKLCKLVVEYGEEILSDTCQIFPREIHEFSSRKEFALMSCCPEAVDWLNRVPRFLLIQEESGENTKKIQEEFLFGIRDFFCSLAQEETGTPEKNFLMIFYIAKEMLHTDLYTTGEDVNAFWGWLKGYSEEKNRKELADALEHFPINPLYTIEERNELFLDLSVNYQMEGLYQDYLTELQEEAKALACMYESEELEADYEAFCDCFLEYHPLMRKFLASEIYGGCYFPEGDLESMTVHLEWIAMEYAVLVHALFLYWRGHKTLPYDRVRDYVVVISRMTGYDEEDIYEYLENSFEELRWDFGYFALIIGK